MKRMIIALVLVLLMVFALAACGEGGAAEDPNAAYYGTYNLIMVKMGPLVATPTDMGVFEGASVELQADGKAIFNDGESAEDTTYTIEGSNFTLVESDTEFKGTIENDTLTLAITAETLGGEGDAEAMTMYFGKDGTDAVQALEDELAAAGTFEEQLDSMDMDQLQQFIEDYSYLMG